MSYFNYRSLYTHCSTIFGGYYDEGASAGVFCLYVNNSAALYYDSHGRRLMFL